jgi:hypothetical protein
MDHHRACEQMLCRHLWHMKEKSFSTSQLFKPTKYSMPMRASIFSVMEKMVADAQKMDFVPKKSVWILLIGSISGIFMKWSFTGSI